MTKLANSFGHVYFRVHVHVHVHKSFLLKIPHGRGIYSVHIALKYIIAGGICKNAHGDLPCVILFT